MANADLASREGQHGVRFVWCDQAFDFVIDVLVSEQRDAAADRRFFTRALRHAGAGRGDDRPAAAYLKVFDELLPAARHLTERYENNPIEADHGRLKARLRPMRGLQRLRCAVVMAGGHASVQNLLRGLYELGLDLAPQLRLASAFDELAQALCSARRLAHARPTSAMQQCPGN